MKADPKVIDVLEALINTETDLGKVYFLNGLVLTDDLGVKTGKELSGLGKQCLRFRKKLIKRLRLRGVLEPEITPRAASGIDPNPENGVKAILQEMLGMELSVVQQITAGIDVCLSAKDYAASHFLEHLLCGHTIGWDEYEGHVKYLEHEIKQWTKVGETDYVQGHWS